MVLLAALFVVCWSGVAVLLSLSLGAFFGRLPFSAAVSVLSMNGSWGEEEGLFVSRTVLVLVTTLVRCNLPYAARSRSR